MEKKIGILGGAFNPPHKGHLTLAKRALEKFNLDKIIFVPAGIPPLKKKGLAPAKERLEMVKILVKGKRKFTFSDYEIKKAKISYTIESLNYFKRKFPQAKIFWIIGEDCLKEIIEGKWKGGLRILDLAKFVVASRPGYKIKLNDLPPKLKERAKKALLKVERIKLKVPISGTEIRKRIKKGKDVTPLLPKGVLDYIKKKNLYGKNLH